MFYNKSLSSIPLSSLQQNKPSIIDLLQFYLNNNTKTGYLIFQVYQDSILQGILPVVNVKITVSKLIGNGHYISKVIMTDCNGKTKPLHLPTVSAEFSRTPGNCTVCSTYNAHVEAPNFLSTDVFDISVFDSINSIQTINLLPRIDKNYNKIYQEKLQRLCPPW